MSDRPPDGAGPLPGEVERTATAGGVPSPAAVPVPAPAAPPPVAPPVPDPVPDPLGLTVAADPFEAVLKGAVLVAFLAVATAGVIRIQGRVASMEDFQVDLSRARVEAPPWMPPAEVDSLRRRAAAGGRVPLRRPGLPEFLGGRLEGDPRVVRVLGARRVHPDAVEVLLHVRRPVALVEAGGGLVAVDGSGVRIPGDYAGGPYPVIRGGGGPLPEPGRPFGREVAEGASVAALLPPGVSGGLGLSVVDVSGLAAGGGVTLRRKGSAGVPPVEVEWGRAPAAEDAALDPPPGEKVRRLLLAARRFPGLEGLRRVRLGFDDLVVVPL